MILTITASDPRRTGDYIRDIRIVKAENIDLLEAGAIFNPAWLARIERPAGAALHGLDGDQQLAARRVGGPPAARPTIPTAGAACRSRSWSRSPTRSPPTPGSPCRIRRPTRTCGPSPSTSATTSIRAARPTSNIRTRSGTGSSARRTGRRRRPRPRWGAAAGGDAWMQFAGMRAAQMAAIWDEVFGPDADARLVKVISTQTGWRGLEAPLLEAPLWVAEDPARNRPPAALLRRLRRDRLLRPPARQREGARGARLDRRKPRRGRARSRGRGPLRGRRSPPRSRGTASTSRPRAPPPSCATAR